MHEQLFKRIHQQNRKQQIYGRSPSDFSSLLFVVLGSVVTCIVMFIINAGKRLFCLGTPKRKSPSSWKKTVLF